MESAVECEAIDVVGSLAPTDTTRGLEHEHLAAPGCQLGGTPQTCQPGTDHDHVMRLHEPSVGADPLDSRLGTRHPLLLRQAKPWERSLSAFAVQTSIGQDGVSVVPRSGEADKSGHLRQPEDPDAQRSRQGRHQSEPSAASTGGRGPSAAIRT